MPWQYSFDPSQFPVGSLPAGWKEYGTTGKATIQDHATYGRHLELQPFATSGLSAGVLWEAIRPHGWDTRLLVKFVVDAGGNEGPRLLHDADISSGYGYKATLNSSSGLAEIHEASGSVWSLLASAAITFAPGEVWWLRFDRETGDGNLALKAWKDGTSEPTTWLLSNIPWVTNRDGVLGFEFPSTGIIRILFIGIGKSTDPPNAPLTFSSPVRIRYGTTSSYTTSDGKVFEGEKYFGTGSKTYKDTTLDIQGTTDDPIYQYERYSNNTNLDLYLPIPVPLPDQTYRVKLHFAELWWGVKAGTGPGDRIFNINIGNGQAILNNFDIAAEAGSATALVKQFDNIQSQGGILNIDLLRGAANNPKIDAIEIEPQPLEETVSASLLLSTPTITSQADSIREASGALQLSVPQISSQADEVRDVSSSLALSSPQVSVQADELKDVAASLALSSPQVSGSTGGLTTLDASLLLTQPQTSGQADLVEEVSASLALASSSIAGQASEIREASAALLLTAPTVTATSDNLRDTSVALQLGNPSVSSTADQLKEADASLLLSAPTVDGSAGGLIASAALALTAPQLSGRTQFNPIASGQIQAGALAIQASVDEVGSAAGRVKCGALVFYTDLSRVVAAQAGLHTSALLLSSELFQVSTVQAGVQVGALQLQAVSETLDHLSHVDVTMADALQNSVSVEDALHAVVELAD